ncbi:MAG: hypothetical protein KAT58_03115 [candidate division Zixibacteria bacterium]|nr:hypothetical protein [candidate division Zixibacteria bacterium]
MCLVLALLCTNCGKKSEPPPPLDGSSGFVSANHSFPADALKPDSISRYSDYDFYYVADQLVFLGEKDSIRYVVNVKFARGLNNSRYLRAEHDFTGYYYDGKKWIVLPYTRARHDSTELTDLTDYYFGGCYFSEPYQTGLLRYDRHGVKFEVSFSDLKPVQNFERQGVGRRAHAIGSASLAVGGDTITGTLFYQSFQLDGFNPLVDRWQGVEFINYDWLGLLSEAGGRLVLASDSTTSNDMIYKNFLSRLRGDTLLYAEGADYVRINSDKVRRDNKIFDFLALEKSVRIAELDLELTLELTEKRFFYTSGFCLAIVEGEIMFAGEKESVWGILEHKQQSKSDDRVLY